ncbi:MAG TPA: 50S ribosomal protein L9 [Actinomycetota bacterium]|jgi:large subunit ribosomal protein L9|nr:50S ribosomal protein L9 [Actinomycetota bacterium]
MKIILHEELEKLGQPGDIVQVADGYARNYLIPRGLAAPATKGAVAHAERLRRGAQERERRAKDEAQALAVRLSKTPIRIAAQAGEDGRLFGSITGHHVAEEITRQLEASLDHRRVRLEEPIRSLGVHQVRVHLHPEVDASVTVDVVRR